MSREVRVSIDTSAVPDKPAGAGRYVLDLVAALARQPAIELTLVCRKGDDRRWRVVTSGSERQPMVLGMAPAGRPARLAWEQLRLPGLLGALPLDVHHGPHYTMPERARISKVVTIHDLTFLDNQSWHEPAKVAFFRRAIKVAARRADALIAVSQATGDRLQALLSPRAPVYVIPHGVDTFRFHPTDPADPARVETDAAALRRLRVECPYVLFVGTLEPRKDVPTLVRAFDTVAGSNPGVTLVLAGAPGWGAAAVHAAIGAAKFAGRIMTTGYVSDDDKAVLLRHAAAVAYPSLKEGFGLPALEALASGAPLVTTSGSVMASLAKGAALTIPAGDATSLAEALEASLLGGTAAAERRRRGLEIAAAHTWDASAAAHADVYRSVA